MKKLLAVACVALASASCKKDPPPAPRPSLSMEQKQKIATLVGEAKALARELDDGRLDLVAASKAEPSPLACPYDGKKLLPQPLGADATTNAKRAFSANLLSTTLTIADVVDPDGKPQNSLHPSQAALEKALAPHDSLISSGQFVGTPDKAVQELETDLAKWRDGGDCALVQKKRVDAQLSGQSITAGRVAGRFYFISRKDKRVACLVDVDVTGPRGFIAWGETNADLSGNAASQLPHRLTGEAVIEGLATMRAAK
jgi:hypothetical protein